MQQQHTQEKQQPKNGRRKPRLAIREDPHARHNQHRPCQIRPQRASWRPGRHRRQSALISPVYDVLNAESHYRNRKEKTTQSEQSIHTFLPPAISASRHQLARAKTEPTRFSPWPFLKSAYGGGYREIDVRRWQTIPPRGKPAYPAIIIQKAVPVTMP